MPDTLRTASIFTDHCVLQRDIALPIWGTATPGATVSVRIAGQSKSTTAGADGKWNVSLDALPAGGPHELMISSDNQTLTLIDMLIGDVWVCSGQSNMEWTVAQSSDAEAEVAGADFPQIRLFHVPRVASMTPASDVEAEWKVCTPANIPDFSAVAYSFGREIQREIGVPIGLINSSWGGTAVECWIPRESLAADASVSYLLEKLDGDLKAIEPHDDPGNVGFAKGFADPKHYDRDWPTMIVPRPWLSAAMNHDGSVWFRQEIEIPAEWAGRELQLIPGVLNDFDVTYFNGTQVGSIGKETAGWWSVERSYRVPANLVKAGKTTIAVRVFSQWAAGGMMGPADRMKVFPLGEESSAIDLSGEWNYTVELALPHREPADSSVPVRLFNGMIAPLIPSGIRGVIWYQGESNAQRAFQYRTLFPMLIHSWRNLWNVGDFPFLFVQLANYEANLDKPAGSPWAELREAQTQTLSVPNSGQAITIDIGEARDIHPRNKRDVGRRLAYEALRINYGKPAPKTPTFESLKVDGSNAVVTFAQAEGLRSSGEPSGFTIAGSDDVFHLAKATIDGASVVLSSLAVSKPVSVRYGWSENPACNLFNADGLPVGPFRTDDLEMMTRNAK